MEDVSNLTRQTSYTYDTGASTSAGLLMSEIVEPEASSDPTLRLETDYQYDAFGNKTQAAVTGCVWTSSCNNATRTTQTQYDTVTYRGQFATQATNALSQSETWSYAGAVQFGAPTGHTGPNGLTTTWSYDTFGRKTLETRPDGNKTAWSYVLCTNASCPTLPTGLTLAQLPANVQFYVLATPENSSGAQNGPLSVIYYDGLSRKIATDVEGFDGTGTGCTLSAPCWIRSATQYDANGRLLQTSRPYFVATGTPKWTVNTTFDALGRVTLTTFPDSSTLATTYCGLTTSVTNALSQIRTKVNNAQGLVAQVYEQATAACNTSGALTSYVYDAFGDLLTVTDPASHVVANNTYDIRGRKTKSVDADMGTWTYVYDGFGELYSQTDAKSQVSTLAYDALGRVLSRIEIGQTSSFVYDTASGKGVGQPATAVAETSAGGSLWGAFNWGAANWSSGAYGRVFSYDSLGRPLSLTLTLDGAAGVYTLGYDANGRLLTVAYPSGFTAKYAYTSLGYLYQISDNGSGAVFWTGSARDAELHLLTQLQGSGITTTQAFDPNTGLVQSILAGVSNGVSNQTFNFDSLGRLTSRTWLNNAGASVKENSCFDGFNRLTSTLVTGGTGCTGTGAVTVTYDALGDITSKSDICATVGCFAYGAGAGPHALTSIAGTYNGVVNPTFAYDANGVMTSGAGRTVTPTSFNMAASIVDGSNTAALAYDVDHARYRMVATGQNAGTTYYLNDPSSGAMEEKSIVGGVTTWHDYILVEGRMVAERFCTGAAPCASGGATLNYFVLDHLGSITVITDGSGNVLQRLSYDAWGKRRNADGTALNCTSGLASPSGVNRGFTGQEMIDGVCLINFNARIYDPSIGRFMAADPVVGDATVPQELNRFSYVLNDPLSLTDPSGLCGFWCIFRDVLAVAVVFIIPEVSPWIDVQLGLTGFEALAPVADFVNAAITGGLSGLIASGGSVKGAALGALEAGLFDVAGNFLQANNGQFLGLSHVPSEFIVHGLVGGLVSEIGQGNLASGFLSGGISSLAPTPVGSQSVDQTIDGTIESAALGGVGSVLGGGKFQNGAVTGAFGYLFNACFHQKCWASATDLAARATGGPYGFWNSMCAGGDPLACTARYASANAPTDLLFLGTYARVFLETSFQYANATQWISTADAVAMPINGQMTQAIELQYSNAIVDAYIRYIGTNESTGRWPSWAAINQIHWRVNAQFEMGPESYPGTLLGPLAPNLEKGLVCPKCAP